MNVPQQKLNQQTLGQWNHFAEAVRNTTIAARLAYARGELARRIESDKDRRQQ